ncbi:MAG: hypothetical protein K2M48_03765 [Clostridiales bacterium]|nr:hypothetical protein [Clostridiales bacterium]
MYDLFFKQMQNILGGRFDAFKDAFENKPRHKALRVNTLKISVDDFVTLAEKYENGGVRRYGLRLNPLCAASFYTEVKPSTDPLYHAGLYYMQEPSASAAVAAFSPYIGKRVLDLCAAPGGKSTQAAAFMNGGTLFCNEIEGARARALVENLDRLGVSNAVATVGDAGMYRAAGYDGYFDTLIVDAPCSGGGMMRYETVPYSEEIVAGCAARQRAILDDAAELLCEGGYMLYSTCTFAPEENERNVEYLIGKGFEPIDVPLREGEERGIGITEARRIYPHNFDGEGHFYCVLQKRSGGKKSGLNVERAKPARLTVGGLALDCYNVRGVDIVAPIEASLERLRTVRVGAAVAEKTANRDRKPTKVRGAKNAPIEFSHAFTHALDKERVKAVGAVELTMPDAEKYIRGEQLCADAPRGNVIATVEGYALGKAKAALDGAGDVALKNMYPKSLRI